MIPKTTDRALVGDLVNLLNDVLDYGAQREAIPGELSDKIDSILSAAFLNSPWHQAPFWAKWHAEDGDGQCYWFSEYPAEDLVMSRWCRMDGHRDLSAYKGPADGVMRLESNPVILRPVSSFYGR